MSSENSNNWVFNDQDFPCDFTDMDLDITFLDASIGESFGSQAPFEADLFNLNGKSLEDMTRAHPPLSVLTDNLSTIHSSLPSETEEAPVISSTFTNSKITPQYVSGVSESSSGGSNSDSQESSAQDNLDNQQNNASKVP
jgi:hypothetical protein